MDTRKLQYGLTQAYVMSSVNLLMESSTTIRDNAVLKSLLGKVLGILDTVLSSQEFELQSFKSLLVAFCDTRVAYLSPKVDKIM